MGLFLTIWIIGAIVAGILASRKNRSVSGWVLGSLLLTPLIVLILLALPPFDETSIRYCPKCYRKISAATHKCQCGHEIPPPAPQNKQCPFCAEDIKSDAIVCKHCQRDLPLNS